LVELAKTEPIKDKYLRSIAKPLSVFVADYQIKISNYIKLRRTTPIKYLPAKNSREYDYHLKIFQLAYCLTDTIRAHRWIITKKNEKTEYKCKYCNITIDKVSISNNDKIDDKLSDQRIKEAFFELYTISCPVKDAHVFEHGECVKCGITTKKMRDMDEKYYKTYNNVYTIYRQRTTNEILTSAKKIILYATPFIPKKLQESDKTFDDLKLESIASNLGKIFTYKYLGSLGIFDKQQRSLDIIKSYVRMFYAYYTFAKNISIDITTHYDLDYFKLVKKLFITHVGKQYKLTKLPQFPESNDANQLLLDLLTIISDILEKNDSFTNEIVKYILNKIILQNERYKEFNFAKLKALPSSVAMDIDTIADSIDQVSDENEIDIFNGYDIDGEDMEDNINGYTD